MGGWLWGSEPQLKKKLKNMKEVIKKSLKIYNKKKIKTKRKYKGSWKIKTQKDGDGFKSIKQL